MISRESLGSHFPLRKLGEIAVFLDHLRRPVKESERVSGPYPYLGANGVQGHINDYLFDEPLVLLAEDGGNFASPERGIAYRVAGKTWVNNHAHVLRPGPETDWAYLARVLENYDVRPFVSGTTRGKLTKGQAENIVVPLPTLSEQRRIAAILDQADALRAKRRAALTQLDEITKTIFSEVCAQGTSQRVTFSEVVHFQEGPGVRNWQFRDAGIKLLNVKNIVDGSLVISNTRRFLDKTEAYGKYSHFLLDDGDLVLASSGVTWGKIAEVKASDLPLCLNTSTIRLRPKAAKVKKSFIRAFVEYGDFRSQIERLITGSAQPNFGPSHLKQITIPLLSLSEQDMVERVSFSLSGLRAMHLAALSTTDSLFASLQHRAFNGEL